MKAIKAIYQNGKVKLSEKPVGRGPMEIVVIFPEPSDDPWEAILNDSTPRPALSRRAKEVQAEIAQGKAKPLKLSQL
jgi:hypothetical protein